MVDVFEYGFERVTSHDDCVDGVDEVGEAVVGGVVGIKRRVGVSRGEEVERMIRPGDVAIN